MALDRDVEEVRSRVPIEDLIRDYNITLLPAGGRRFKAICPFHTEKTPSFHVNTEGQFFHCFGCKASGDIFTFVQKLDHLEFAEALEILARRAGVTLQAKKRGATSGASDLKLPLYDALSLAEEYYHRLLMEDARGAPARSYLERRGIRPDLWRRFRLGYSLPEWEGLVQFAAARGMPLEHLERAGVARAREGKSTWYDYFRERLMFPIHDAQRRVVGFGARTLGSDEPKYLNTPKTVLFDKGQVLYGLPQARASIQKEGRIAIMEGYTDVIMAHQMGMEHAVASLGTAFTDENARRLRRIAPRVDLVFDGDAAGQSAAERTLDLLVAEDLEVRIYTVTTGKDPFDALLELGGEEFQRRMECESTSLMEFKWRRTVAAAEARGEGPQGVARALDDVLGLLAKVPNLVARKLLAQDLAERIGLGAADLEARLARLAGAPAGKFAPPTPVDRPVVKNARGPCLEELIVECLLAEPERAAARFRQLPVEGWLWHGAELDGPQPAENSLPPGLPQLAKLVTLQLREGRMDVRTLQAGVVGGEAGALLYEILARIDHLARMNRDRTGSGPDREETWKSCLRDLERKALDRRCRRLDRERSLARDHGDRDLYLNLQREYFEVQRRLKGHIPKGAGLAPTFDLNPGGETEKGTAL